MENAYLDTVFRRQGVRCRSEANGRFLLYNPSTDGLHLVGAAEKAILDLCDGRSITSVVTAALPLLPVGTPSDAGARSVLELLRAFAGRGLVEFR